MPLGFERLNERASRPNALINFIKPLPGAGAAMAERILNRVAARCYPLMRTHRLAVMALEEHAPNREFVGRNFNAGEVVQLVLRRRDGRWLSVKQVEMIMVHELAHCKHMNHSRLFWRERDAYAAELRALWAKGYTGEGLWGRGWELDGGAVVSEDEFVDIVDVESLCGGTYRSRQRKRKSHGKQKPRLSYAERQQRRILRKFGTGGTTLGTGPSTGSELQDGKGKPRVASSARGRELRAAAALARLDKGKDVTTQNDDTSDTESDAEYEEIDGSVARDVDGNELQDSRGNGLVRVCNDQDQDDNHVRQEMEELRELRQEEITKFIRKRLLVNSKGIPEVIDLTHDAVTSQRVTNTKSSAPLKSTARAPEDKTALRTSVPMSQATQRPVVPAHGTALVTCSVCSLANEPSVSTCAVCANVLKPETLVGAWKCKSLVCYGGAYFNTRESKRCGVCGAAKEDQQHRIEPTGH